MCFDTYRLMIYELSFLRELYGLVELFSGALLLLMLYLRISNRFFAETKFVRL